MSKEVKDIFIYLTTTDEITIKELALATGWDAIKVYRLCCICIHEYKINAKIEGGVNGKYVNYSLISSRGSMQQLSPVPPQQQNVTIGSNSQVTITGEVEHGANVTTAKEYTETGRITTIQHIERIEAPLSKEMLDALGQSKYILQGSEEERLKTLNKIEKIEDERNHLRRKARRSHEEDNNLEVIYNELSDLNESLNKHNRVVTANEQKFHKTTERAASETMDNIVSELKKQEAQNVTEVITGNKDLFEMIESFSIIVESKRDPLEDQLKKLSDKLDLRDEHLEILLGVLDGATDEVRSSIKTEVLKVLEEAGDAIKENKDEVKKWLLEVFDNKQKIGGRFSAIRNLFSKVNNWIKRHPKAVTALRILLTGTLTAMGVPIPIV